LCHPGKSEKRKILTAISNVCDIVVFKIQDTLGVLNNSSSIRGKEVLNGLRKTIFAQESARLATLKLGMTTIGRQKVVFNGLGFAGVADYKKNESEKLGGCFTKKAGEP
jgi:hypothetical protein